MFNNSGLNEECGVFGIWNHPEAAQLTWVFIVYNIVVKKVQGL